MHKRKKILVAMGTRPEVIKLAPVIRVIEQDKSFELLIAVTAQHREMLDQTLAVSRIVPNIDMNLMEKNQKLTGLSAKIMVFMQDIIDEEKPDLLICQGDTTSALICGLASYYCKVPIAHVEAGLRTYDHNNPFPEEGNRQLLSVIASLNFCPTETARQNLLKESIKEEKIFVTGNTVVDSLLWIASRKYDFKNKALREIDFSSEKIILVTTHRRENFGKSMENVFKAMKFIIEKYNKVRFVLPVHMNPNVRKTVRNILGDVDRVLLLEPLNYEEFVHLMQNSFLILSDSGGIQEEAPSFGVPVLIIRRITERMEALDAGTALLIGTNKDDIIANISGFLDNPGKRASFSKVNNPFGDGIAAQRILAAIKKFFGLSSESVTPFTPGK